MHKEINKAFATEAILLDLAAKANRDAREAIIAGYPKGTHVRIINDGVIHDGVVTKNFGISIYVRAATGLRYGVAINGGTVIEALILHRDGDE